MYGVISIRLIIATGANRSSRPCPWVARITGMDEKYGLARQFQKPVYDYSRATRKGKNAYVYFNLPPGIYEVWHPISWKHETRYFTRIDDNGDLYEISRDEVMEWLNQKNAISE